MRSNIFKTFLLLAFVASISFASAQTASILPPAKTQFLDNSGKPLTSGTVDFYIPSTTTRKTTWQNSGETVANANPVVLDAGGRAIIYGDGVYRQVVKDRLGNIIWDQLTSSSGSGSSTSTATGDGDLVGTVKPWAGLTAPNQYMLTYGQEVSRTTYSSLFTAITSTQVVFCNSGSPILNGLSDTTNFWVGMAVEVSCVVTGASTVVSKTATTITLAANANVTTNVNAILFPWGRGNGSTTFNIPDYRGIIPIPNNNMGGVASSNIAFDAFYSTNPNSIGGAAGSQFQTLIPQNLPAYTPSGTIVSAFSSGLASIPVANLTSVGGATDPNRVSLKNNANADAGSLSAGTSVSGTVTSTFTGTAQGGVSAAFSRLPPVKTINYIIKVTPDVNAATASGVTSLGGMTGSIACGSGLSCTGNIIRSVVAEGTSGYALIGNGIGVSATFQGFLRSSTGAVNRTWNSKVADFVNVKDFGAVCDGVTDDGPAAQLAHNTGLRVIYPAATCYIATPVVMTSGYFQAQGQGPRVTVILTKAAAMPSGASPGVPVSWNAYSLTGMSGVYFSDMTIDGNTSASTNPSTSTQSDLRVPIEIISSNNVYLDNMEFFQIKAPIFNYSAPGLSTTLIPQLKTGQFWIASPTGNCRNVTILNTRIKYPTFVEGGQIVNCQNVWVDNFKSFDDNPGTVTLSLSTPLHVLGPLSSNVWINNAYLKDHLGSAMNLSASYLKVTNSEIIGPTLYTQAITGFPLTVSTTSGLPTTTITAGSCSSGGLVVSVGQNITGSGVPASTTVASCSGATLTLSANATATASVVVTLGGGSGPTDQVRYGGGIDSGEELSYSLFTDQGVVQNLEFTGNSATGVRDSCVNVYNGSALGTYNYSKVVIANNICVDAPISYLIGGVDGINLNNNYINTTLGYPQVDDMQAYYTGPIGGEGALVYNTKNFNMQNNNIDGGTAASYGGITAYPRWGINTQSIDSSLISNNSIRDFTINGIYAHTTVNNTGSDLRFISNAIHGTPTTAMVIGETGLTLQRADIANNTLNGIAVASSQASVFVTNLDSVPVAGLLGSEALRGVPIASAANRVEAIAAIAGVGPTLAAAGSDTNIPLKLAGKGTGVPQIPAFSTAGVIINDSSGNLGTTTSVGPSSGGTGITSYIIGDLLYASGTTTLSKLADIATGNALISGGVGVAPAWGKVGLITHVSGILPIANGGTGVSLAATGGTSQVLKQATVGANITVGALAFSDISGILSTAQGGFGINVSAATGFSLFTAGTPSFVTSAGSGSVVRESIIQNYISGLTLSTAGSSATFGIAAGIATDSTNTTTMVLASAYTKTTSSWAVGTGNGALDTGAIANNTWYHVFQIKRPDTSVVDVCLSASVTGCVAGVGNIPAAYTVKRRIGSMSTNGAAQWISFFQDGNNFTWDVPFTDFNGSLNPGTSAILRTLYVPTGINVFAVFHYRSSTTTTAIATIATDPQQTDTVPDFNNSQQIGNSTLSPFANVRVRTNTVAQVRFRLSFSDATAAFYEITDGWVDSRGQ